MNKYATARALLFCCFSFSSWSTNMHELQRANWRPEVYEKLKTIIAEEAGRGKKIVLDLDWTIWNGDIEEETSKKLISTGLLSMNGIPACFLLPFKLQENYICPTKIKNLEEYRQNLKQALHPSCFYAWATQVLGGLSCQQVIEAADQAYFAQPNIRAEMIDLIGMFLHEKYDVWIVSASPVQMVRWFALKAINPMLAHLGFDERLKPGNIIGINTLLQNAEQELFSDYELVSTDLAYANLEAQALSSYMLTNVISAPISAYEGKVAAIQQHIKEPVYFGAGDSLSDKPFLELCEHKLWFATLSDSQTQKKLGAKKSWLIQPILPTTPPRFLTNLEDIKKLDGVHEEVFLSLEYLGF